MSVVLGHCDPAFQAVREVFEQGFADGRNLGAGVTVFAGGKPVVDLWGGIADKRTGRAWERDTPCFTFSCTKAVTATAALLLAERGALALDAPVTGWWPEFGVEGKEETTAEHFLTHQAGLPAFDRPLSLEDAANPAATAAQLASQTPEWTPGSGHGYHALTYGWLTGEIVRRHAGTTVGEFVREEFAPGLWIGSPPEVLERAAKLSASRQTAAGGDDPRPAHDDSDLLSRLATAYMDPQSLFNRTMNNPAGVSYNDPVVLAAGWPAAGLVTTARDLAGLYRDLVGGKILRPETLTDALKPRVNGPDRVLLVDSSFGLGYMRPSATFFTPRAGRDTAFGHTGAGGAVGLGDVDHDLALAFIPNLLGDQLTDDPRAYRLIEAAYSCLG